MFNIRDSSPHSPLCVPGSRGRLRLFLGDRAHIPMYTQHSAGSVPALKHTHTQGHTHPSTESSHCARPSSSCSVTLSPNRRHPNSSLCTTWGLPIASNQQSRTAKRGNPLVVHHSAQTQPAPWRDQSVTGGTNPGPRESPCPGQPGPGIRQKGG